MRQGTRWAGTDEDRVREALQELLATEGWAIFARHCLAEWTGEGFFQRLGAALKTNDPMAPAVLYNTSMHIQRLLQWPAERVRP